MLNTESQEIRRERLYEQVARQIEKNIANGHFRPDEQLPPERDLVAQYGVSRTVIREAINSLSIRGLVRVVHGKGAIIAPVEEWKIFDAKLLPVLSRSLKDLLELRKILEVEAAGLAAERGTEEDLQEISSSLKRYEEAFNDVEKRLQADIDFHSAISRATENHLLPIILEPLSELLRSSRKSTLGVPEGAEKSRTAHIRICEAIKKKDAPQARQAMREHLREVEEDLKKAGIL